MVLTLMNQSLIIDAAIIVNYYLILLKCFIYNQWLKERVGLFSIWSQIKPSWNS